MEAISYALAAAIAAYFIYEIVVTVVVTKRHPNRVDDGEDIEGRVASVHEGFGDIGTGEYRSGSVELNGAIWKAELRDRVVDLVAGDDCRVIGRNGLTLLVGRIENE